jgi:chlorophyll/bacteriochlorophyll a synthase
MARPQMTAILELLKPVTWFPPMWAFGCGAVSAGPLPAARWPAIATGVLLAGPLVCATSQAVNDWFDRHVDAINEPQRPIPSGRMPGTWGLHIAIIWTSLSLAVAATLGTHVLVAAIAGLALAWAYSAPPPRLKQNGWWGNAACAACYEGLAWLTGAMVAAGGSAPEWRTVALACLYSVGAHGIMTLNDFKSIEGDRQMGIGSLPVRLGAANAGRVACLFMAGSQVAVIALLLAWGRLPHAIAITVLLVVQVALMKRLLADPRARAPWYNATGVSLYVIGMLMSAFAIRSGMAG